jgi:hypothetical protein
MPISASDPRYQSEKQPPQIMDLQAPLCATYARPSSSFGCKGNLVHDYGGHRSFNWIVGSPDSRYRWSDATIQGTLNNTGLDRDDCCAMDFTPGVWGTSSNRARMVAITQRVYEAARARDPRLSSVWRFAGTLNGTSVITFNCADGSLRTPFDSSHLDHIHIDFWRSRARWNHSGLLELLTLGADDMAQLDDVHYTLTHIDAVGSTVAHHVAMGMALAGVNELRARPPVDAAAVGNALAGNAAFVAAIASAVAAQLGENIRSIVDEELDEQSRGGADTDPPA